MHNAESDKKIYILLEGPSFSMKTDLGQHLL